MSIKYFGLFWMTGSAICFASLLTGYVDPEPFVRFAGLAASFIGMMTGAIMFGLTGGSRHFEDSYALSSYATDMRRAQSNLNVLIKIAAVSFTVLFLLKAL